MRSEIFLSLLVVLGLNSPAMALPRGGYTTATVARAQKNLVTDYGATCNGVADDTAAFVAFKAAFQGTTPVQLNIPGFCNYLPDGGTSKFFIFKGISDLIVQGTGTATSGIKNLAGASTNFAFGGAGQVQDNAHSLRTNTANAGDSCVTVKTAPSITVSGAASSIASPATFTASAAGTTLTVTAVGSGTIKPGAVVYSSDSQQGFFNTIQPYGTGGTTGVGGTGTYALRTTALFTSRPASTAPASFTASVDANGVMTVSAIADGALAVGMGIFSFDGAYGGPGDQNQGPTTIRSQLTGSAGSTGTYQLDNSSPNGAIGSQVFQGTGQIRLGVNSTSGLTSGDDLYISGVNGTGVLPQRVNGLKWIKVVDGTHLDLFQMTFDGAYTSGGAAGGDRTSLVSAGSKVMMTGYSLQSYWGAPNGFPSNQHWFEWLTVASTNSGTHQICFTTTLANAYKDTWPQYNTGSQFEVDPGGPATLYAIDASWDLTHVYKDFTLDNASFQTNAGGRNVTWNNVAPTGNLCMIPSQNETYNWLNIPGSACTIETDKLVGTWNITSSPINQVDVQSSSINTINIISSAIASWFGSPKRLIASAGIFSTALAFGAEAYGATDEVSCANCSSTNAITRLGSGQRADNPAQPWSMSGGVITIPNAYSFSGSNAASELQVRFMVPGHYQFWSGSGGGGASAQVGRAFKITDITQDTANTYVTTSEAGGFPTGAWTTNGLAAIPHPTPQLTVSSMSGNVGATIFNGCPAQAPMFSCQNVTYTGGASGTTAGFTPTLWGELDTFTFTNNVPYTNTGALTWDITQFDNWPILKTDLTQVLYGASPNGQAVVNTKLPSSCGSCTRTLMTSGATNTQTGDTITVPPSGALFGGSGSGPAFSTNTPSDSPQVTVTLRTNQHLP
jgi:hypothetical protein